MAKRWTPEEDALMLKMREEGYTAREIAAALPERTYAAVRTRIASIAPDNRNRPWTEEEKQLVYKMKAEGKSNKVIARALDRTQGAVSSFVFRYWNSTLLPDLGD